MNRSFLIVLGVIGVILLLPLFAPYDPMTTQPELQIKPPDWQHVFGTDYLGRDVLSRFLYGGRRTLAIAGGAALIAMLPAAAIALISVVIWKNEVTQVVLNAILAFPNLLLALVVLTLGGRGVFSLMLATGLAQVAPCVQVLRARVLELNVEGYVDAAVSMGASRKWIMIQHILPNLRPLLVAYGGVTFSYCLLNGAALSFLGLGGEPGVPDWGVMLAEGRLVYSVAPWVALPPGIAITLLTWLVNRSR